MKNTRTFILTFALIGFILALVLPAIAASKKSQSSKVYTIDFNLGYRARPIPKDVGAQGGVQITYGRFLRTWEAGKYTGRFSCFEGFVALVSGNVRPGTITFKAPSGKAVRIIGFGSGYKQRNSIATSQVSFYLNRQSRASFTVELTNKLARKGFFTLPKEIAAPLVKMVIRNKRYSDRAIDDIQYTLVPASSVPAISIPDTTHISKKTAPKTSSAKTNSTHTITFDKAKLTRNSAPIPGNTGAIDGVKITYHNFSGWDSHSYKSGSKDFSGYVGYVPGRAKASIVFNAPEGKKIQVVGFDSGYAAHKGVTTMHFYVDDPKNPDLTLKLTDKIAQGGFYKLPKTIAGHTIKIEMRDGKGSDRAIDNLKYCLLDSASTAMTTAKPAPAPKHLTIKYSKTAIGRIGNTKPSMGNWWLTPTKVNGQGHITGGQFGLIRFGLYGIKIPAGMKVGSAVVKLAVKNNGGPSGGTTANGFVQLHRLKKKILWDGINAPTWESASQYYDTKVAGQLKEFNEAKYGHSTLDIPLSVKLVQGWLDGSIVNGGLSVWNLSPDGKAINTYTPGKDTAAALKINFVPISKH